MNEMSGFGLQERLAVPIICMTAHDDAPTRERILPRGGAEHCPQKRIDHYIDYFGRGSVRRSVVTPDPCGESLLDAGRAR